jgi:hypothetical protein
VDKYLENLTARRVHGKLWGNEWPNNEASAWHNKENEKMGFSVSDRFKFCNQSLAEHHGFTKKFQVTGYTCTTPLSKYVRKSVHNS